MAQQDDPTPPAPAMPLRPDSSHQQGTDSNQRTQTQQSPADHEDKAKDADPPSKQLPQPRDAQVGQIYQRLDEASSVKETVKQQTQETLEKVRQKEEQARQAESELQETAAKAQQHIEQAQSQVARVSDNQEVNRRKLEELANPGGSEPTIAGYDPMELLNVFSEPPKPKKQEYRPPPKIDSETKQQIDDKVKETTQEIKHVQDQVNEAKKGLEAAQKTAGSTEKRQKSIIEKMSEILKNLQQDIQSQQKSGTSSISRALNPLIIVGLVILVLAVLLLPFTSFSVWGVVLLIAIGQLGAGLFVGRKGWM